MSPLRKELRKQWCDEIRIFQFKIGSIPDMISELESLWDQIYSKKPITTCKSAVVNARTQNTILEAAGK